jgi:diguanylate cyclase
VGNAVETPPPGDAPHDVAWRIRRRRQLRRRLLTAIAGSYAVTTLILLLYAWAGTTRLQVPLLYAASGALVWAAFFAVFRTRLGERAEDWFLTVWQLLPSAAVEVAFLAVAAEVGFVFLMVLFVIFGFGTLRLTPAKAVLAWGVTALGVVGVMWALSPRLAIPAATHTERWITVVCFVLTLGRCVGTGLLGSQYRIQLAERTAALRRLTATLEEQVALRTQELARANQELERLVEERTAEIKTLQGVLPICSYCKKIRDDKGAWTQLEGYIGERADVMFSHGICAECQRTHFPSFPNPPG